MNESNVIAIFVAANPSKDIGRAGEKLSEKNQQHTAISNLKLYKSTGLSGSQTQPGNRERRGRASLGKKQALPTDVRYQV